MKSTIKRLFFGMEVHAPWPHQLPKGRLLQENNRHMTVAFLGDVDFPYLMEQLNSASPPLFDKGLVGNFDKCLLLPPRHPNVVAWRVKWLEDDTEFHGFLETLFGWLQQHHFIKYQKERDFLPHVTIARTPFDSQEWMGTFHEMPMMITSFNLYESVGNLNYEPRWRFPLIPPFVEIEHTADIAFEIYGKSIQNLYQHAQVALAFKYPPLLSYLTPFHHVDNIDELIIALNKLISQADGIIGCPFKAVSFHDNLTENAGLLKWEMIVNEEGSIGRRPRKKR